MQATPLSCPGLGRKALRAAVLSLALGAAALSGCAVYRHEVLQGNFISKEQVQALQAGMPREQVRQILGTPLITDMFRANRWDYVFTMRHRKGVEPQKYTVTVFFEGDALARVEGMDELPTNQDFVNLIGRKKPYKARDLQATPEQLSRFAESNPLPAAPTQPTAPASNAYPPLPQ